MQRSDLPELVSMSRENMAAIILASWGEEWKDEQLLDLLLDQMVETVVLEGEEGIEAYYAGTPAAVPPAPSSLIAAAGPSVIGLSWSDPATNENGFRIERRTGSSSSWETLASVGPNVTAFADYAVTAARAME